MSPMNFLALLLRTLQNASIKHYIQRCRYLGTILWRLLQCCTSVFFKRRRSEIIPPQNPLRETFKGNDQESDMAEAGSARNTQILASLLPTERPRSRQSGRGVVPRPPFTSSSSSISLNVVPPNDDIASTTTSQFESGSPRGDSRIAVSSQIFRVLPGEANGSQVSLVIPASSSLLPVANVVGLERSGNMGFSRGISEHIYPLLPYKVPRWKRKRFIPDVAVEYVIKAYQDEFSIGQLPVGWEQLTHPGGQPYFYHAEKRIVTECWIWDERMFEILNGFINQFEDFTRSHSHPKQPDDVDLLLEVNIEDGVNWCGYYYVSASTRSVFWLEIFDISDHISNNVRGNISPTHIKLYLEYQYWVHWDLFPNVINATVAVYDLVANAIANARTAVQSSRTSTVNHSKEDLKEMAEIVEGMKARMPLSASHWCIGRFMHILSRERFLNYHGQYGARLEFSQSVHSDKVPRRTWLIKICSPLLLSAPDIHLKNLNELWVDKITLRPRWVKFFVKMNDQWREHIVHGSILLNANVAFLAIPSNEPSNNARTLQSLSVRDGAQISSYLSVLASFTSVLLALMLVRKHKTKEYEALDRESLGVEEYHEYAQAYGSSEYGFEGLAIVYSLPYALLTWSMATFLVAVLLVCFVKSTTTVRSIIAIATALICGLILWSIWMFSEKKDSHRGAGFQNLWKRVTGKIWGNGGTEFKRISEVNENGGHNTDSTAQNQNASRKGTLHSWLTRAKSRWGGWRGYAWLKGDARSTTRNTIPLSHV